MRANETYKRRPINASSDAKRSKTLKFSKHPNRHTNPSNNNSNNNINNSHSSEEISSEENENSMKQMTEEDVSIEQNETNEEIKLQCEKEIKGKPPIKIQETNVSKLVMISAIVFGFLIYLLITKCPTPVETQSVKLRQNCSFTKLKKTFTNQDHMLWDSLKIGIEGILNNDPTVPGVYLFLHENNLKNRALINSIAQTASACFDPNLSAMELNPNDFLNHEKGFAVEKYKKMVKDGGALLVANLNEIPGKNAQDLHFICDTHSPIARRVIIFLTLSISSSVEGNPIEIAENELIELWGKTIQENNLLPLITRVTDSAVLRLNNE